MTKVTNVTDAAKRAKGELIKVNGILRVVMFQVESVNLINYEKNNNKPTWRVRCSFYTDMSGTERVSREVFIDQESGEVVDMNGHKE